MALNFKTLLTRTLTAAVFVAILLSAILWSYYSFTALFLVVSLWGLYEFYKIAGLLGAKPYKGIGYLTAGIFYLSAFVENMGFGTHSLFINTSICLSFLILLNALFSNQPKPIENVAYTVLGMLYCVFPFYILNRLTCFPIGRENINSFGPRYYNHHIILGIILLIWASDTLAYLVGSMLGKHKLYERISPGKTWEGTIGGGILTLALSYIVWGWFPELQFIHWLVIAGIVVVFGTLGDLFESLLKRQAGIKDSGKIMPGHGGILDRFDSLMFVSPFAYLYLNWVLS